MCEKCKLPVNKTLRTGQTEGWGGVSQRSATPDAAFVLVHTHTHTHTHTCIQRAREIVQVERERERDGERV